MAPKKNGGKGKRSKSKASKASKSTKSSKPSKALTNAVQKIISKNVETKRSLYSSSVTSFNQGMNQSGDCLRLLPDITVSGNSFGRVGNVIRLQSLRVRGVLTFALTQTQPANVRIGVRMLIIRTKAFADWTQAAVAFGSSSGAGSYTRLLEGGISGYLGSVMDFNTPVNTDAFSVVSDKRFYMSQSVVGSGGHTTETWNTTKIVNFDVPYCRNKILHYDDNAAQPADFQYFMLLGYSKLDGTVYDSNAITNLTFQYTTDCKYEDA